MEQVLRLLPGDRVIFFNGKGREYECVLFYKRDRELWAEIQHINEQSRMPEIKIHLCQSLAKGAKMDYVIQKAAELGVCSFRPVLNRRSVVRLDEQKAEQKRMRWHNIAKEAGKQCGRNTLMQIEPVCSWEQAISSPGSHSFLVLYENEKQTGLRMVMEKWRREGITECYVFVGPEGGYAREEIDYAVARGGDIAGLGPRVLRTETAGLVAISIILYEWGEL